MNILLVGANGRMGKAIQEIDNNKVKIIAGVDLFTDGKIPIFLSFNEIDQNTLAKIDMVLDFSSPTILEAELEFCKQHRFSLIICCTGHTKKQLRAIKDYAKHMPILKTQNTSTGIFLIKTMLNSGKQMLDGFDVCIIETHHKNKKDKPSGTAKMLMDTLGNKQELSVYSIRGGTNAGEHEIKLMGEYESISIKHVAEDRKLFAVGAIKICEKFSHISKNGYYELDDILKA